MRGGAARAALDAAEPIVSVVSAVSCGKVVRSSEVVCCARIRTFEVELMRSELTPFSDLFSGASARGGPFPKSGPLTSSQPIIEHVFSCTRSSHFTVIEALRTIN